PKPILLRIERDQLPALRRPQQRGGEGPALAGEFATNAVPVVPLQARIEPRTHRRGPSRLGKERHPIRLAFATEPCTPILAMACRRFPPIARKPEWISVLSHSILRGRGRRRSHDTAPGRHTRGRRGGVLAPTRGGRGGYPCCIEATTKINFGTNRSDPCRTHCEVPRRWRARRICQRREC